MPLQGAYDPMATGKKPMSPPVMPQGPTQTPGGLNGVVNPTPYGPPVGGAGITPAAPQGGGMIPSTSSAGMNALMSRQGGATGGNAPLPGMTPEGGIDYTGLESMFIDPAYQQFERLAGPQMEAQKRQFEQSQVARGIDPKSAQGMAEFDNFSRGRNDLLSQGAYGALQAGMQGQGQFANQLLQQQGYDTQRDVANIGARASVASSGAGAAATIRAAQLRNELGQSQLAENARQFDGRLGENARQFDNNLGYQYSGLNEGARQFDVNDIFRNQQLDGNMMLGMGNMFLNYGNQDLQRQAMQNGFNQNWFNNSGNMIGMAPGANFMPTPGLTGNSIQAGNNVAQANANAMGGIMGLGGAVAGAAGQAGGFGALFSSERYKDITEVENIQFIHDAVMDIDVKGWKYNDSSPSDDREQHFGPTAEEWADKLRITPSDRIEMADFVGAVIGTLQVMNKRLKEVENVY